MNTAARITMVVFLLAGCGGRSVDGEVGDPNCGDPAVKARFSTCMGAGDQAACEAAGGEWRRIGLSPDPACACPTGQEGCACNRSDQCLGACIADLTDAPNSLGDCKNVTEGTCSPVSPTVGCWCWFYDDTVMGMCAD